MESYNLQRQELHKIRKQIFESVSVISNEVERILNAFALDDGDTMISWNSLRVSKIGVVLPVNEKVSFSKYYEDNTVMKFKCYMKAGGVFGVQEHDCLEETTIEKGHLIELLRGGKKYNVGETVTYLDSVKHKPLAEVDSVYDVIFTKKRN